MEKSDNSAPIENLTTRAFVLLRKLVKTGKLTEAETIELVEIHKEMPATSFESKLDVLNKTLESQKEVLDTRLKSQDSKYNLLLWFIGIGVGLIIVSNFVR